MTAPVPGRWDELRRLAAEATEGGWEFGCGLDDWHITTVGDNTIIATSIFGSDGEFIAAARNAIPALLEENEALRGLVRAVSRSTCIVCLGRSIRLVNECDGIAQVVTCTACMGSGAQLDPTHMAVLRSVLNEEDDQ